QVGFQVVVRNLDDLSAIAADKGYDSDVLRTRLWAEKYQTTHYDTSERFDGICIKSVDYGSPASILIKR
ncbi:MAG: hypothetical protein V5A65_10045, partial [Halodesulfurarchaeum sp.]